MALFDAVESLRRLISWAPVRRPRGWSAGTTELADARRLADAERAAGEAPAGCAWLDERTVEDLDLPLVFRTIDRTVTPTGAQALWRWLVAPAIRLDVLAARERALAPLAADPALRDQVREALAGQPAGDAPHLPRLLWEPPPPPLPLAGFAALVAAFAGLAVGAALWWPPLALGCLALFIANIVIDDWASLRLAHHGRALEVLVRALAAADRVLARGGVHDAAIARDLAVFARLRARVRWLTVRDPFDLADLVRAGLLARVLLIGRFLREIDRERARLRRVVLWLGELDALVSIASLRAERTDTRLPWLTAGAAQLTAGGVVHPAIAGAVGNDLALDAGLLITGSNMSGKSTFLRAVAINAICAQSIHTTFGTWRASLFRVFAVMRIADATAAGMSTYAVEVAAIGALVDAVARRDHGLPALFVIDEPFSGTNPALRVPIVVSTLDYLGARDLAIAATHDLDVAAQVDARFMRGYFREPDDDTGQFDRTLRAGVAPTSNALALLVRAGYPQAIITAVERRVGADARRARVTASTSTWPRDPGCR
jgi:MutS-like protein